MCWHDALLVLRAFDLLEISAEMEVSESRISTKNRHISHQVAVATWPCNALSERCVRVCILLGNRCEDETSEACGSKIAPRAAPLCKTDCTPECRSPRPWLRDTTTTAK